MFKEIKPIAEELRKYILSYNILEGQVQFPINYFAFPHTHNILTFFNHTTIQINKNELLLSANPNQSPQILILGRYLLPLKIKYESPVDEISINFKPLAINHFFETPFSQIAPDSIQKIDSPEWLAFSKQLFETNSNDKIEKIEKLLLSQLRPKPLDRLQQTIELMEKDETITINQLAKLTNQTERTLSRNFGLFAGCTPSAYKRISRFRKSIDLKYLNDKNISYTDICFSNSYYDTTHFRKEFRRLTGQKPKDFFDTVSLIGEGNYPFRLV